MDNHHPLRETWQWLTHRRPPQVPVLLQMNATDCGAACLAMVLSYFGRKTRVAECSESLGVGRDGLTAHAIAHAARSFGLRAKAYSLQPKDLAQVPLPAIVHWNFNHFVVVERSKWCVHHCGRIHPSVQRQS